MVELLFEGMRSEGTAMDNGQMAWSYQSRLLLVAEMGRG